MNDGVLIHAGINFIFSPAPDTSQRKGLDLQRALIENGVDVAEAKYPNSDIVVLCKHPVIAEIKMAQVGPNVGQFLIVASHHPGSVNIFGQQAASIVRAFRDTWPDIAKNLQLVTCDTTLRFLYETEAEHAFGELWETRLGQSPRALHSLGSVLGGGLRFVIPPMSSQQDPHMTEVKIESFLQDTSKLFVETLFKWEPISQNNSLDPERRLRDVNEYIENQVAEFMDYREGDDD